MEDGRKLLELLMKNRGGSDFLAGGLSLADLYLAPIMFYVALTPDAAALLEVEGLSDWWQRAQALESYRATQPNLG